MGGKLYLFIGNDEALVTEKSARLVEELVGPSPDAFAFDVYQEGEDGPEASLVYGVLQSIKQPPFLGGVKTVWLKHFTGFRPETLKGAEMTKAMKALAAAIEAGLPDDIQLILDVPGCSDNKRSALVKACETCGAQISISSKPEKTDKNWQSAMVACIQSAMEAKGVKAARAVIDYLIEVIGTDTSRIDCELEKVICYRGTTDGTITLEDVRAVCDGQGEEFSWSFSNAIGKRDLGECLRVLEVLTEQGKNADTTARSLILTAASFFRQSLQIRIFMQSHQISNVVALKRLLEQTSETERQVWLKEGVEFAMFHPYRVQMIAEQAMRYQPQELIKAMTTLRDALWQCISSSTSPRVTLENALFAIIV